MLRAGLRRKPASNTATEATVANPIHLKSNAIVLLTDPRLEYQTLTTPACSDTQRVLRLGWGKDFSELQKSTLNV
jgi:hypothetical protein